MGFILKIDAKAVLTLKVLQKKVPVRLSFDQKRLNGNIKKYYTAYALKAYAPDFFLQAGESER